VEDSWCWEPDGGDEKGATGSGDAARSKESDLVDIALGNGEVARLNNRIAELEQLNTQLNASLEELDSQHELAMQDVLEHKTQLSGQVANLKQQQADRLVEHELANARQQTHGFLGTVQFTFKFNFLGYMYTFVIYIHNNICNTYGEMYLNVLEN